MSQGNMNSVLQSSTKNWDLTPYELQRTPQEVITDDTEIAVSPRSLHNELMCPICLDMLRLTMTTKECLHRFCAECITTALRSGNKECPTCRKKLVSRRSLRPDPNFDALISKIYPSRDEYEAHQERMLQSLTKHHNGGALSASIEEGLKSQAMSRLQRIRRDDNILAAKAMEALKRASKHSGSSSGAKNEKDSPGPPASKRLHLAKEDSKPGTPQPASAETTGKQESSNAEASASQQPSTSATTDPPQGQTETTDSDDSIDMSTVEMIFKPHPEQKGSKIEQAVRYIKTSIHATVQHMAEFVKVRIGLEMKAQANEDVRSNTEELDEYQIFVANGDSYKVLSPEMNLETVQELHCRKDEPLEIFYLKNGSGRN